MTKRIKVYQFDLSVGISDVLKADDEGLPDIPDPALAPGNPEACAERKLKYEIWLGDHYSHYWKGVAHLEDGSTTKLYAHIHVASYCSDSILFDHEEMGNLPLRWMIYPNSLHFYSVGSDTPDVILHNESGKALEIECFTTLGDGESMEIQLYPERVIKWVERKPNETTLAAMEEVERMKEDPSLGLGPFETVDELMEALNSDDDEKIDRAADEILQKYRRAFEELAK